jgi:sugar lactone lactonase YvrE
VSGATGYQWNISDTYPGGGVNVIASPNYTQTGLTCNTTYTLYVWAYNSCGYSYTALTQSTSSCRSCAVACGGSGNIATIAGNGTAGYSGDGNGANCAELHWPAGVAVDGSGNVYIGDFINQVVRKVTPSGIISTFAGNGIRGYSGDGGAAISAELNAPVGVAVDGSGNVYIVDDNNNRIRKVTVATGIISTIAGNGTGGYNGDGIAATAAELYQPSGVAVDGFGNVYIGDAANERIRKVNTSGIISTFAGDGVPGYNGDGIAATDAKLETPTGVAVDASGNVYIVDDQNLRIRKVNTSGTISTIAGNGTGGYNGDGIAATSAELNSPTGVAVDSSGNVYIADYFNFRIREVCH